MIVHRLPFEDVSRQVQAPSGEFLSIRPRQLPIWVSVTPPEVIVLPNATPVLPALLDTGFNDSFLIQESQLERWANLDLLALRQTDVMHVYGSTIPVVAANVWIYRNLRGTWNIDRAVEPFCLELFPGIGISPDALGKPRLPLIGMRALMRNRLQTLIDGHNRHVSIRAMEFRSSSLPGA
jgi:hypothetical protein